MKKSLQSLVESHDAMGTQTEIAKQIVAKKADYVLALKANHPTLYSQIQQWFETEKANNFRGVDIKYDKMRCATYS